MSLKLYILKIKQGINKKVIQPAIIKYRKRRYKLPALTIISSDCSGGVFLHDYGLALDTPTVNLLISGDSFCRFCENLDEYLAMKLEDGGTENSTGYPIAMCGDVKIVGVHYKSFESLASAWNRRKQRVHKTQCLFLMTERQLESKSDFIKFSQLRGRKIFLCSADFKEKADFVIPLKEFDRMFLFRGLSGHRYIDREFNFARWFLG